ncbi:hypothetical protein ACGFMK_24020 [Amycolatopsis sp. NPDC049252]|uniref:hypothetical protein n=1 Tax=Amycolatopsis sp. NPDC049252 TaxID=3363933 RepID=UPI003723C582
MKSGRKAETTAGKTRPAGKLARARKRWPSGLWALDGPWLPPGDDARPAGAVTVPAHIRRRLGAASLTGLAAAGLVVFGGQYLHTLDVAATRAHASDITVTGRVVDLRSASFELAYPVGDGKRLIWLPQRRAEPHGPGDQVEVVYSPADPLQVRYPEDIIMDRVGLLAGIMSIVAGTAGTIAAIRFGVLWWDRRRAVLRTGWRPAGLDLTEPGAVLADFADGSRIRLRPSAGLSRTYSRLAEVPGRTGFLAGSDTTMVLLTGLPDESWLMLPVRAVTERWLPRTSGRATAKPPRSGTSTPAVHAVVNSSRSRRR